MIIQVFLSLLFSLTFTIQCPYPAYSDPNSNSTQCLCPDFSVWSGQRCQCQAGTSLDENDDCLFYEDCTFPCQTCKIDPTKCLSCPPSYTLKQETCEAVSDSVLGQYLDNNGTKIECSGGCESCSSINNCSSCADSYQLSSGECLPCQSNCKNCSQSRSVCQSCFDGYYLNSSACFSCQLTCLICDQDGCIECLKGYYVSNGQCTECSPFCDECTSTSNCSVCQFGYVLLNGETECVQCLLGCNNCSSTDITQCVECSGGYYNNSNGKCVLCPDTCSECTSQTQCTACVEGYVLSNGLCEEACPFPCDGCTNGICEKCFGGYNFSNGACSEDVSCNHSSTCSFCPRKWTFRSNSCFSCAVPNCIKCFSQDAAICTYCLDGYFISSNVCSQCPDECVSCLSQSYCRQCKDGYYMLKKGTELTGRCQPCKSEVFCQTCKNLGTQCTACISGYTLSMTKCISYKNIGFEFELLITLQNFMLRINDFKRDLIAILEFETNETFYITFRSLREGSTIVQGNITLQNQNKANEVYDILDKSLQTYLLIGNITIVSTPFLQKNNFESIIDPEPPTTTQSNLGLIIGVSLVGFIILLIIIIAVVWGKKRNQYYFEQGIEESSLGYQKPSVQLISIHVD